jgi:hypothetical protein
MIKLNKLKFLLLAGLFTLSLISPVSKQKDALAANGSDFSAGNIIDDATFWNKNAMSVQEIQSFLNSKVPSCDTWGQKSYNGQTRAQYGASIGSPTPFVCLKDYIENPSTKQNNLRGESVTGGRSAAQLIYDVSQSTGVSPKVILVMLQKEQGLITDDWPFLKQYRSAMGYACPDTAPCDSQYYGFYNQILNGANIFNRYKNNPSSYRYKAGQNNQILWNPNADCGTSTVYLENQATAGLYIYTPYRPNQAALNNMYGTGDGCSAYGNRNFWRYYTDWFGSTHANIPSEITSCPAGLGAVYRFWNNNKGGHFYTADYNEVKYVGLTWPTVFGYEGKAFCIRPAGMGIGASYNKPLYRFWSDQYQGHFYTMNEAEKNDVIVRYQGIWNYEGVVGYVLPTQNSSRPAAKPVYRFWSPVYNRHFYTISEDEKNMVIRTWPNEWHYEGVAYWAEQ